MGYHHFNKCLVKLIARQTLKLALEAKTGIKPPAPYVPPYSPPATWPQETLDAMSGTYAKSDAKGGYLKISSVPGGLEWTDAGSTLKNLLSRIF